MKIRIAGGAGFIRSKFVRRTFHNAAVGLEMAETVMHFAAESHVGRSVRDSGIFVKTNVLGTPRLIDATLRADLKRFAHVSTHEVRGSIAEGS